MIKHLQTQIVMVPFGKVKTLGGPGNVTDEIVDACLEIMVQWIYADNAEADKTLDLSEVPCVPQQIVRPKIGAEQILEGAGVFTLPEKAIGMNHAACQC